MWFVKRFALGWAVMIAFFAGIAGVTWLCENHPAVMLLIGLSLGGSLLAIMIGVWIGGTGEKLFESEEDNGSGY